MDNPTSAAKPVCLALMVAIGAFGLWHGYWLPAFAFAVGAVFALAVDAIKGGPHD